MGFLDLSVSDVGTGFGKLIRAVAWLLFASALAFGSKDVLFWLRTGSWDITRTGLALSSFNATEWAQGWVGLHRALVWVFHVPLAYSLAAAGFIFGALGGIGRDQWD